MVSPVKKYWTLKTRNKIIFRKFVLGKFLAKIDRFLVEKREFSKIQMAGFFRSVRVFGEAIEAIDNRRPAREHFFNPPIFDRKIVFVGRKLIILNRVPRINFLR